jgi:hypothetical protein
LDAKAIAEHYGVEYNSSEASKWILPLADYSQFDTLSGIVEIFIK